MTVIQIGKLLFSRPASSVLIENLKSVQKFADSETHDSTHNHFSSSLNFSQFLLLLNICTSLNAWASLVAQLVKNPPAMQETWVQSLGWEDPLEKGKAAAAAAAAAKSLQPCPTLCNPIDGGPPGSPVPGILQARMLEWVAISFSNA